MPRLYPDPFGPPWRFPWVRMILTWNGGIFQILWFEWMLAITVCAVVITVTYLCLKDNDSLSDSLDRLSDAATFVSRRFQAAMALMLGFYSIQNFARWKEVRNAEGNVMKTVNDLALRINWSLRDSVQGGVDIGIEKPQGGVDVGIEKPLGGVDVGIEKAKSDEKESTSDDGNCPSLEYVRFKLIRWLNLSHAIAIGDLYEMRPNTFSSLEEIRDSGLATHVEYNFLKSHKTTYTHVAPLDWFMGLLDELRRKELFDVDGVLFSTLAGNILQIRGSLADLYMYRNTPIPLSYKQLTNVTVRVYMAILLVAATLHEKEWVGVSDDEDNLGSLSRGSFWFIMVFAFEYFLFVGWVTVADAIGNPYRYWSDELDWELYVEGLTESSLLFVSGFRYDDHMSDENEKLDTPSWNVSLLKPPPTSERLGNRKGFKGKRKLLTGF